MNILNIAGYRFVQLVDLVGLRYHFLSICDSFALKGTILLSTEGINISLAGEEANILSFKTCLTQDARFQAMRFHESYSTHVPFQRLKVKLKKEIITFRQNTSINESLRAPSITPVTLKKWLDEQKEITLLDTRNNYEVELGTFKNAINPNIEHFTELTERITSLDQKKPVVMFCTGGIRCEKAAQYMHEAGFEEVYQLDGGILGYFSEVGSTHWQGSCFVFDDRIALDPNLVPVQS